MVKQTDAIVNHPIHLVGSRVSRTFATAVAGRVIGDDPEKAGQVWYLHLPMAAVDDLP
jgi:hypothetical protein